MDEIIDYVMETPGNTNPNVLRGMLNNRGGGSDILLVNMIIAVPVQIINVVK